MNTAATGGDNPESLLAEAIVDDAVRRRRAENWSRQRAADDATVLGTLSATLGEPVVMWLAGGEELSGVATFVGPAAVVLEAPGTTRWIRPDAVQAVAPESGRTAGADAEPTVRHDVSLPGLLADLVDGDRTVEVRLAGGGIVTGAVLAVGASLVLSDRDGRRTVVELGAVDSVALST